MHNLYYYDDGIPTWPYFFVLRATYFSELCELRRGSKKYTPTTSFTNWLETHVGYGICVSTYEVLDCPEAKWCFEESTTWPTLYFKDRKHAMHFRLVYQK